ncbi:MAG: T9SS type A sorting domain-containing protein [Chitinophagales bacterium]|nr:T9SS type A sorting domain-containing protein [Chitinophagales bacterium]
MIRTNKHFKYLIILIALLGSSEWLMAQEKSVARRWNEVMLQAIREDLARPPVQARNLFHVSMAMWDAWAAYDTLSADTYLLGKTVGNYTCQFTGVPLPTDIEAARKKAMSYAAYRVLSRRFQNSPNAVASIQRFRNLMGELGYDWTFNSNFYQSGDPAALGNYIGDCVGFYGLTDGANEAQNYAYIHYLPVNPALVPDSAGNPTILDPNHWQPLELSGAVDQQGNPIPSLQRFQSPEWGNVVPFAMPDSVKTVYQRNGVDWPVYHDPGPPAALDTIDGGGDSEIYKWNHSLVAIWSSHLTTEDSVIWDISPASIGNTPGLPTTFQEYKDFYNLSGGGPSLGRPLNPKTGQPYQPQLVPRGDYTRVLAQFWADGPNSETPPGHWFSIFNMVMDHPQFVRKFNGTGEVMDTLEYDIKAYFTLGGALHDAAITAWGIKGWYDGTRPISALRYMVDRGQSSDPNDLNYHPSGIPLQPGYIELVKSGDPLEGANGQNIGKIKLYTWKAFDSISSPTNDIAGVGWILAEHFWPYQRKTFVTPPFAGFISGHSTYSRAAAEALTLVTGDEYFPGGMGEFHIAANSGFLGFEKGPSVDVTLQWATYRDASDQTSLSRIWGGIHPPEDDIPGRKLGARVGIDAFNKAKQLFYYNDADLDGFDLNVDCDDSNPTIYPNAPELCDGLDNNCNGTADDGLPQYLYYVDTDGDGFGNLAITLQTCQDTAPAGYVLNNLDCIDFNADSYPGAPEICDGLDNDCNGDVDDGLTFTIYYEDLDGDGFGTTTSKAPFCTPEPPAGFVANNLDCDDNDPTINPNASEICDDIDNNCDGLVDEELPTLTYFTDADGDGFGDPADTLITCQGIIPVGFVGNALDCDDNNAAVNPDGSEGNGPDGLDNDCNGLVDDFLDAREVEWPISLFPNPVTDQLVVKFGQLAEELTIQIVDVRGKVLKTAQVAAHTSQIVIDFNPLPDGVYSLVAIRTDGQRISARKVVKL